MKEKLLYQLTADDQDSGQDQDEQDAPQSDDHEEGGGQGQTMMMHEESSQALMIGQCDKGMYGLGIVILICVIAILVLQVKTIRAIKKTGR